VYLSKIDIADGFYRTWVKAEDAPKLAVLFPSRAGEEALIGVQLTLPMGWKESPPVICRATETVANLANDCLHRQAHKKRIGSIKSLRHEQTMTLPRAEVAQRHQSRPTTTTSLSDTGMFILTTSSASYKATNRRVDKSSEPCSTAWIKCYAACRQPTTNTGKSPPQSINCSKARTDGPRGRLCWVGSSIPSAAQLNCHLIECNACWKF